MSTPLARLAGAPITWGVCEVPDWGCQLQTERVLRELAGLGLGAVELGPPGFLPHDPEEVARTLDRYGLRLAGGFVPVILHRPEPRSAALSAIAAAATALAAAGGNVLVLAAELGNGSGYDRSAELSEREWAALLDSLDCAREVALGQGVQVAFHPHYGTAVECREQVERVVAESDIPLCVDTGHLLVGGADPLEVVRAAGARVAHVHFKDVDAALAARVRAGEVGYRAAVAGGLYRPLGEGDVDVAGIVRVLRSAGYEGWYVLEQDIVLQTEPEEGEGPVRSAARSVDYFKGLVQG